MKTVTVIGHFGFGKNCLDGQTIKTKILTKELEKQLGTENVNVLDTHGGKKALPKLFFKTVSALRRSKSIIMLPAHNGIKFFTPLLTFFNRFHKRKLFYVVIGGWLPKYLKEKKGLQKKLKTFDGIFVETKTMQLELEGMGFKNIFVMPNCKDLKVLSEEELVYPDGEPYKLCTFSRVSKEKGIEDAVKAVMAVNGKIGRVVYKLDIYGQIDKNQTEWFSALQATFPEYIQYCGMVSFDKSVETLKNYFALLFPTYYQGEGFAGTLIDAMASGVPVVASKWKYNSEVVEENKTGYLFDANNIEDLIRILLKIKENSEELFLMKKNCLEQAKNFLPENVIKIFIDKLK